ncbi:MAG: amidohydrolase [Candidatus Brockarchaeota archaeon]|nr:amidohydrolase [Candidatus Brockarchaeota archaeon]
MSALIRDKIAGLHVIDTHEHTYPHELIASKGPSIFDILEGSYVFWESGPTAKGDYGALVKNLRKISGSSFYKSCSIAVRDLYGVDIDPPTACALEKASEIARDAYRDRDWILKVFKEKALIDKALLDPYWNVWGGGFDERLFSPVFRINMLLFGYSRDAKDHNGNNPYALESYLDTKVESFEDYLDLVDRSLEEAKRRKYVAVKSALAYDRPIVFEDVDASVAKGVFEKKGSGLTAREVKLFGDFILNRILIKAGELGLPVQFHTGLALIEGSSPMNLVGLLRKHANVDFVFFHGGYPWIRETAALAFTFPNLYLDLCWLPIISPSACKVALREIIELGLSSRTMWGGDCWVAEATYGALKVFKKLLSEVLQGMVFDGYLKPEEALDIASGILMENAARFFKIA